MTTINEKIKNKLFSNLADEVETIVFTEIGNYFCQEFSDVSFGNYSYNSCNSYNSYTESRVYALLNLLGIKSDGNSVKEKVFNLLNSY